MFDKSRWVIRCLFLGAIIGICGEGMVACAQENCSDDTTVHYAVSSLVRAGGNSVTYDVGTYTDGYSADVWYNYFNYNETVGSTVIHSNAGWSAEGDEIEDTSDDAPSMYSPGTYALTSTHWAWAACYGYTENPGDPVLDSLVVNAPTITGFLSDTRGFWNLGPGTSDPQPTTGGANYYQSFVLTFHSNCNSGDTCDETPAWSFVGTNNQATSTGSGATITIGKGSSQGNCQYDSTISVSIGGFSSGLYSIDENSPVTLHHTSEETVEWTDDGPGYTTEWRFEVHDACTPYNVFVPVPISENFPSGFVYQNGGSNYATPSISNWDYTNWTSSTEFTDSIGQTGTSQSPSVLFDYSAPPYSDTSTVYFQGSHTINVGSMTTGNGYLVYSGTIRYYTDHGDNNP
jgi:hypothetical protein